MTSWHESLIDKHIRLAQERGEFDDLPGTGEPIPGAGQDYHQDWWLKDFLKREGGTFIGPPAIALRKECEELAGNLAKERSEAVVREYLEDLNARIIKARKGPVPGPPVTVEPVDIEAAVTEWHQARRG